MSGVGRLDGDSRGGGPTPCYLDHDGGNDDFVALLYLLKHQTRYRLSGITVTPANSWWEAGTSATRKIVRILADRNADDNESHDAFCTSNSRPALRVAESTLPGKNPFPDAWRFDACRITLLPQLNRFGSAEQADLLGQDETKLVQEVSGQELLARTLLEADTPVTLIVTGPLTNLAWVLDNVPKAAAAIEKVLIMGGAIDVAGNVSQEGHDGSAEWNFYWDPAAAKRVWDSNLKLVLTPLDATKALPVSKDTLLRLSREGSGPTSALVASIWALAGGPQLITGSAPFFAWDLVTVVQLVHPELFDTEEVICDVVASGVSQGRLMRTAPGSRESPAEDAGRNAGREGVGGGRLVTVVRPNNPDKFYDVVIAELCSDH